MGRQGVVFLAQGQEEPAMLEEIEGGAKVPERRDDERDVPGDPLHLLEESAGILDMLDRMGAEGVLELAGGKGQVVDVVDHDEVRDLGVFHDIDVDTPAIGLAAADVEIPHRATPPDDPAHDPVAEPVQGGEEDDEDGGEAE